MAQTKEEKAAAKAAATVDTDTKDDTDDASSIKINSTPSLRKEDLPLIVELPKDASSAQIEYAKILNQYAYTNPDKFETKKGEFMKRLEFLAKLEIPKELNVRLEIKNSSVLYKFYFTEAVVDGQKKIVNCAITLA